MPDHLHWLLELKSAVSLGSAVRFVKGRAAVAVNRHRGHAGRLWQTGYHEHALRDDETVENAGQYIIENPVRAGLVDRVDDYPLAYASWMSPGMSWLRADRG